MASFVVVERRPVAGSRVETEFVRDDFSFAALVLPLVWLLWHRLWFAALMLLLVSVGIGIAGDLTPGAAMAFAGFCVNLFVALEGPAWRLARFRRLGFVEAGSVIARDLDEAEIRWFAGRGARIKPEPLGRHAVAAETAAPAPEHPGMVFGFGEWGR